MTEAAVDVETFGRRLLAAVATRGPLCVGIDPHPPLLAAWGLDDDARGLERFAMTVVEAVGGRVALVKPQSAFFERHGSAGVAVLERVLAALRAADTLALLDAKRGDIGSTVTAYADAYLDPASPLAADALTASPYLGFGSLDPLFDRAARGGRGVFVLALTSNPEGRQVQAARCPDGRSVGETMIAAAAARNTAELGATGPAGAPGWGSTGVVVGATLPDLSGLAGVLTGLNGPILAPGIGAQGAGPADLPRLFGAAARAVVPAVSREVLRAGPDVGALRAAAARVRDACAAALA